MDAAIREITSLLALWLPLGIRWRKDDPIGRNAACYANSMRLPGYLRHRLWRRPFSALPARAVEPIRIGFGMALTGPLAPNGKSALLAMKIWQEDVNAKGGWLGRPVELVHYDDQSNPSTVPGLYTKLLDVDRVELIVGGYRARDAGRDGAQQTVHRHSRTRGQQRVPLSVTSW
jgi:Periplasmic binding protein